MNMELVTHILSWVLPPVLGAMIGYITNYLAIKMLFRPLVEKRIFGIRIPLTPGIIPKQRHVLAESIGNMVSEKLLTFSAFKTHLESPPVQKEIRLHISTLTESLLQKRLNFFQDEKVVLFLRGIENFLYKTLVVLLHSDKVVGGINTIIRDIISYFLKKNTYELFQAINVKQIVSSYILPFITKPEIKSWLYNGISQWTKDHLKKNTPLEEIIPPEFIDDTFNSFRDFLPDLIKVLFQYLRTEDTKTTLACQGRELIKNIFKKLNLFQQFFVSVAQYDKTLTEKMPEIVEDTLISLESAANDPMNQDNFVESAKKAIRGWLKKGIFDIFYQEAINLDDKLKGIINTLFNLLESPRTKEYIMHQFEQYMESNKEKTLKEFLDLQAGIKEDDIIEYIQHSLVLFLTKKETTEKISQTLASLVISLISGLEKQSIWELLGLDTATKDGIDNFLLEKLLSVIELKLPDLVAGLNVKTLVVNKINSLDIADVEKLLLMVIAQHLRWINIFGALLGAMIGFIQVFVNVFIK